MRVVGRAEPIAIFTLARRRNLRAVAGIPGDFRGAQPDDRDLSVGRIRASGRGGRESARRSRRHRSARLYDVYAKRIAKLRENPPADWDGVFTAEEK